MSFQNFYASLNSSPLIKEDHIFLQYFVQIHKHIHIHMHISYFSFINELRSTN